jgi:hypothetical protein
MFASAPSYSIANIDVSGGPVRFEVPDARGRYYVMQFIDAWTNNFAYWDIGRPEPTPRASC